MSAIAIPITASLLDVLTPMVAGAVASAASAVEAAALLPVIVPVATAASGLSVLAAGAAAYSWGAAEIDAMRSIAAARYCAGTPGATGCPVVGMYDVQVEIYFQPGTSQELVQRPTFRVRAPFSIQESSGFGYANYVLRHADGEAGLLYKDYAAKMPEIVRSAPVEGQGNPWAALPAQVREGMAAAINASHVAQRLGDLQPTSLVAGQNIAGNTLIVVPDGTPTAVGEPVQVATAPGETVEHPYAGQVPASAPRPGVRSQPAAAAATASPGAVGSGAGTAIGAIAGAGLIGASATATSATVGTAATASSGIGASSAPRVGAGAYAGAVTGGQRITVGNTTTFVPTTSTVVPANGTAPRVRTNNFAPATTAPAASPAQEIGRIAAGVAAIPFAVGAVMSPALANVPNISQVTSAAATGACQAINGVNPCNVNNPISQLRQGINNIQNQLSALDLAGNAALGAQIAAFEAATMARFAKVSAAINSDRILMAMTYLNTIHNAYMLSSNLTQTLFSTTSNAINAVLRLTGVQSANDEQIDVAASVSGFIDNGMKQLFGVETWTGIKAEWKALSRIYQASANMLFTVQSMFDAARSIGELAAENSGRIGNALKKWGVVGERAYSWMPERVNHTSAFQRKWDNITQTGENIEQAASTIDQVSGNVVEVLDGADQLLQSRKEFDDAIKAATPKAQPDNTPVKAAVEASKEASKPPSINPTDLVKPGA